MSDLDRVIAKERQSLMKLLNSGPYAIPDLTP